MTVGTEPSAEAKAKSGAPLLELRSISKSFPGVRALDKVNFDIREGEVHALLGENGAGKSTLIKILSGVYQPDEGTIKLDGKSVTIANPQDAQRAGIATIYQELLLFPDLSVAENIFMGHAPRTNFGAIDWPNLRRKARELLASLDIHDLDVNMEVGALSVGNRQRVEIAKALSQDARILIMDEPTAALTEHDVERLFGIVRLLRDRGVAVVYISHRLEEVFLLADRVTVLRDGAYVATKDVSDTDHDDLIHMMVGRRIEALFPKGEARIGEVVLEAEDVHRPPTTNGVSITLRAGEIVGLAGLVGSGRTEFAKVLFGVTPAKSGTVRIDGRPVHIRSPAQAKALGIGYVPEDRGRHGLIRPMDLVQNMSMAVLKLVSKGPFIIQQAERELAMEYVDKFKIRISGIDQVAGKLSGGNQQKVVLSKWLSTKPKILIMDEPTRGIDVGAKAEIHRLMSELAGQGMAIIMISSELPEILGMSDRILVMRGGRIVMEALRGDASQEGIASAMMSDVAPEPLAAE